MWGIKNVVIISSIIRNWILCPPCPFSCYLGHKLLAVSWGPNKTFSCLHTKTGLHWPFSAAITHPHGTCPTFTNRIIAHSALFCVQCSMMLCSICLYPYFSTATFKILHCASSHTLLCSLFSQHLCHKPQNPASHGTCLTPSCPVLHPMDLSSHSADKSSPVALVFPSLHILTHNTDSPQHQAINTCIG